MKSFKQLISAFFYPTVWLSNHLSILKKFLLVFLLNLLVISYLGFEYLKELESKLERNQQKIEALELNRTLFFLMISFEKSRGMMSAQLLGDAQFDAQLRELKQKNSHYIAQLKKHFEASTLSSTVILQYKDLDEHLSEDFLTAHIDDPNKNFKTLSLSLRHITQLIDALAHFSDVLLDEDESNFYSSQLLYTVLPPLIELHAQLRGLGTGILTAKTITPDQKQELHLLKYNFMQQLQKMKQYMAYYKHFSANENKKLNTAYAVPESIILLDSTLLRENFSVSNSLFFQTFTKVTENYINDYNTIHEELLNHLKNIQNIQIKHRLISYIVILLLLFLSFYLILGIYISSRSFTQAFLHVTQDVANGNLDSRLEINSQNEYGNIVQGLNNMIKNLEQNTKTIDKYIDISETDLNGKIISVSSAFEKNCGYSKKELIGKSHNILRHPDTPIDIYTQMWSHITKGEIWNGELKNRCKDGSDLWVEITIIPKYDNAHQHSGYISIRRDINNQKQIEKLSVTDYLTQIYNRKYFNEKLKEAISIYHRYHTPFALLMFDIDYFKNINDTFGHLIGDEVLVQLSNMIKTHLRENDIFARWGGEEFMILLPHSHKDEAVKIAQKLRSLIEHHVFDEVSKFTISAGVVCFLEDDSFDTVLERADKALYQAKIKGRNRVVFL